MNRRAKEEREGEREEREVGKRNRGGEKEERLSGEKCSVINERQVEDLA